MKGGTLLACSFLKYLVTLGKTYKDFKDLKVIEVIKVLKNDK
jgi:hypothetical protein